MQGVVAGSLCAMWHTSDMEGSLVGKDPCIAKTESNLFGDKWQKHLPCRKQICRALQKPNCQFLLQLNSNSTLGVELCDSHLVNGFNEKINSVCSKEHYSNVQPRFGTRHLLRVTFWSLSLYVIISLFVIILTLANITLTCPHTVS